MSGERQICLNYIILLPMRAHLHEEISVLGYVMFQFLHTVH